MSDVLRELADDLVDLGCDEVEAARVLREVAGLRDLAPEPASPPTPELAALLGRGPVASLPQRRRRAVGRSGAASAALVALVAAVGATGLSAAANTLPAPVQERVASFSRSWLPFDLPHPDERREGPGDDPGDEPGDALGDPLGAPAVRSPRTTTATEQRPAATPAAQSVAPSVVVAPGRPEATGRPAATPAPAATSASPAASATADAPPSASPGSASTGSASTGSASTGSGDGATTGSGKAKGPVVSKGPRGWKPQVLTATASTPTGTDAADVAAVDEDLSGTPSAGSDDDPADDGHPGRHLGWDESRGQGGDRGQQDVP